MSVISAFFFFQAEDGIRDYKVTGVQTCALPIFSPTLDEKTRTAKVRLELDNPGGLLKPNSYTDVLLQEPAGYGVAVQIGRASCRGKSVDLGGRRIIKKKKQIRSMRHDERQNT